MTYREKLEQYKKGILDLEEKKKVESDIEKQDAISEFLADRLEEAMNFEEEKDPQEESKQRNERDRKKESEEKAFELYIRKSITKSFRKMGFYIGGVLAVILLFLQFGLSPLISSFYYNPKKGERLEYPDFQDNQMSLDLAIYTEMSLPCKKRSAVDVQEEGYGVYQITIQQNISYNRLFHNVSGKVRRGRLELYDPNLLKNLSCNTFGCYGLDPKSEKDYREQIDDTTISWAGGTFSDTENIIDDLDDKGYYYAYVTFQRDLNFEQITHLMEQWKNREDFMMGLSWLGVRTEENNYFTNGFFGYENQTSGNIMRGWDEEKYPELFLWTQEMAENSKFDEVDKKLKDENTMEEHFKSMLRYMADQKKFLEILGRTAEEYENALTYVEENGLSYYGCAAIMDKKTMREVIKQEEVFCIYPIQYD